VSISDGSGAAVNCVASPSAMVSHRSGRTVNTSGVAAISDESKWAEAAIEEACRLSEEWFERCPRSTRASTSPALSAASIRRSFPCARARDLAGQTIDGTLKLAGSARPAF
jgi:hypothetical protein